MTQKYLDYLYEFGTKEFEKECDPNDLTLNEIIYMCTKAIVNQLESISYNINAKR